MRFNLFLLVPLFIFVQSFESYSQSSARLNFFLATQKEIYTTKNPLFSLVDTLIIPKQNGYKKFKLKVVVDTLLTNIGYGNFIPQSYEVDSNKTDTFYFHQNIVRDSIKQKTLVLNLVASDTLSNPIDLNGISNPSQALYIDHYGTDSSLTAKKYEFWMFIGTNLDLVDGIQAQDLYFRADYLTRLKNNSWLFVSLGKSRYFDNSDSINNGRYSTVSHLTNDDTTINSISGYFNGLKTIKTDNLFCSLRYLYKTSNPSNEHSKFFITGGIEIQYLTITSFFSGIQYLTADTNRITQDTSFIIHPLTTHVYNEWNYNASVGLMHILDVDDGFDIKTQLVFGLNYYQYASDYLIQGLLNTLYTYNHETSFYSKFRIDATVLNPGISLGFEVFTSYRKPNPLDLSVTNSADIKLWQPLFNISLTKVLNLNHLKSLFSPVASAN